jgi:ATP-dependent exoDNAse (exonuclease V) alpha subunit
LQGFLARGQNNDTEPQTKRLFLIDESSLASTNHMRGFLRRMSTGDRVLLIGDTRQHQGVEAGRPFQQLQEAGMNTAKLEEIIRQKDPALKATVEMLAHGQTAAAIEALRDRGSVKQIVDAQERMQAICAELCCKTEANANRLTRQCLTAGIESGRTPRIEGNRHLEIGGLPFSCAGSAPGNDWCRACMGQPLSDRRRGEIFERK